jgi:hypothetical protein
VKTSFFTYFENKNSCNVKANELRAGDKVEDINPDCKHYKAKGKVIGIEKVKQDKDKIAGNLIKIKVANTTKNCEPGQVLKKTEIQLKKI